MDRWLRNVNVVRIVALVLAIMLWVVVHLEENTPSSAAGTGIKEYTISNVAVTPIYDNSAYFVQLIEPTQVVVTVTGRESAWKRISTSGYSIEVDLTKVTKGEHVLPLTPVNFPSSVAVRVEPSNVRVVIEEKARNQVPVTIQVTGTPATGLKAGQPIIKPKSVIVTVPSSKLEDIDVVKAEVSVEKASAAISKQVKLIAYDKSGKVMDTALIDPPVVDVEVPITSPFATVPLQIKLQGEPPRGFSIASLTKNIDKVTVYGPQEVVEKLEFIEGPTINLTDFREDKELSLDIPLKNKVTQVEPAKVDVKIDIVPSENKTIEGVPISIIGQNDGFETKVVSPENSKMNIILEGAAVNLSKLKVQDVQAIVDVSNLPPGTHELPVVWNLPTYIKKGIQQDFKVSVEISAKQTKVASVEMIKELD
jgi:YbbR domain-containing protein